jgi:hypothetical protein
MTYFKKKNFPSQKGGYSKFLTHKAKRSKRHKFKKNAFSKVVLDIFGQTKNK